MHTCVNLRPYIIASLTLSGQSSLLSPQCCLYWWLAREQLLFRAAPARRSTEVPPTAWDPLVGAQTHHYCHRCNFTMTPVYHIFPVLCRLEGCHLGLHHIRVIWYFTKYRGLNGVRTTNRGQTAATGAGPQCRRYKRATRSLLPSPGFILYTEMQSFGTSPRQWPVIWYFTKRRWWIEAQ